MKKIYPAVIAFFIIACVDPFNYSSGNKEVLVIEGGLFDVDSSYISLGYSSQQQNTPVFKSVRDAKVYVIENGQKKYPYYFDGTALLFLPEDKKFRPEVGNYYVLRTELSNGNIYETSPDTLKSFPAVKGFASNNEKDPSFFQLAVQHPKRENEPHYYLYKLINYKRARYCSECSNQVSYDVKDSTDCSSYFKNCNSQLTGSLVNGFYGFECDSRTKAWNYKIIRNFVIYSDANISPGSAQTIKLLDVPVSSFSRYFVEIHQSNISEEAFNYFELLKQAGENTGTLYDPFPPRITGNLKNVANPEDVATGHFVVASQRIYGTFVDRGEGQITNLDNEVEFEENIFRGAFTKCPGRAAPLSDIIFVNDYRTDQEPVGWREDFLDD